jgi:hypothetical protein
VSTHAWIITHLVSALFWSWIAFWGGAERLEDTFASSWLVNWRAASWDADQIKFFAWLKLIVGGIWFFVGLAAPGARFR